MFLFRACARKPQRGRDSTAQGGAGRAGAALGMWKRIGARPNGPRFLGRIGATREMESRPVGALADWRTVNPGLRCAAPWAIESRPVRGFLAGMRSEQNQL